HEAPDPVGTQREPHPHEPSRLDGGPHGHPPTVPTAELDVDANPSTLCPCPSRPHDSSRRPRHTGDAVGRPEGRCGPLPAGAGGSARSPSGGPTALLGSSGRG